MIVNSLESLSPIRSSRRPVLADRRAHERGHDAPAGIPATYGKTPGTIRRLPPRLGEHSLEILFVIGPADTEIDTLLASGATRDEQKRS